MNVNKINHYDVVIVGAGVVGLTCALLLSEKLSIAVIDVQSSFAEWKKEKFDVRVSSINRASEKIFTQIAAWEIMQKMRVNSFSGMKVWDNIGKGEIYFDSFSIGEPNLGYIIENNVMQQALLQKINQKNNIKLIASVEPEFLQINEKTAALQLSHQEKLTASLIIGADGAKSWVREQADIETYLEHYGHHALITTVQTKLPHQCVARQCFSNDDILAFLPLKDLNHCSIVWSALPQKVTELLRMEAKEFNVAVGAAFAYELGDVCVVEKRYHFPLFKRHAKQYVKQRIALIGDAAHTIHPLAGQGINLGICDAAALAATINRCVQKNRDMGSRQNLRAYERARKGDNLQMMIAMDIFKRLFSHQHPGLINLRHWGLTMTNRSHFVKNFFMRHAMGEKFR